MVVARIGVHAAKAQQKQMHNKGVARICVCTTKA
jgi:hypothetical protein